MTNKEQQLKLDTKMYADNKSFGKQDYCQYCWACFHGKSCIANGRNRSIGLLCVKARNRMLGQPTMTKLQELIKYAN